MKILYNWLKEFVEVTAPAKELGSRLSLAGVAIDSIEETSAGPVLDAEITSNRPDCLGHYGMAREVAAIYRLPVKPVQPKLKESAEKAADAVRVEIEARDLCGRFTARVVRGVKVQPSPDWLRQRLAAIGQNSINNVVDVSNYVMFELGHASHAFDFDKLNEHRIVVRRAKPGEKIRTLDGIERTLTKDMCVVSDATHAVGIGGVMGGAESEIGFSTRNILIECAWFDPIAIRRASKALGLRTEASYRFERGADPEMAELASRRTAELIQQLAGGEILAGVVDVYPGRKQPLKIEFARKELLRVMGADVPDRDIEEILGALGFHPVRIDANRGSAGSLAARWECTQPSWRHDVTRGVDLVEEVARHYGYDKFPPRLPPAKQPAHRLPHAEAMDRLRERLVALGYQEIVEIPLVDPKRDELFRPENVTPAVIGNPLAEDASVMRSTGIVSMVGRDRMEPEPRAAKSAALRNRQSIRSAQRRTRRNAGPHAGSNRPRAAENDLRRRARVFVCGSERRPRRHWSARGWIVMASERSRLARFGAMPHRFRSPIEMEAQAATSRSASWASWLGGSPTNSSCARMFSSRNCSSNLYSQESSRRAPPCVSRRCPASPGSNAISRWCSTTASRSQESRKRFVPSESRSFKASSPPICSAEAKCRREKFSLMIRVTFQSAQATLTDAQLADFSSRIVEALQKNLGATLRAS